MPRILLIGYFGAGNYGDDALLANWLLEHLDWLDEYSLTCDVLLCGDQELIPFIEYSEVSRVIGRRVSRYDALRMPLDEYSALVAPGGSLLQDVTSARSLIYYLLLLRRFLSHGRRVFMLNQGVGPIKNQLLSWLCARTLSSAAMLSLRDEQSLQWAERQSQLQTHSNLMLSADPILSAGFRMTSHPDRSYAVIAPRRTGDLPYPGEPTAESESIAEACMELQRCGLKPILVSLHQAKDAELCAEIERKCSVVTYWKPDATLPIGNQIWSILAHADLVLSHRLHGLVTAAANSVPAFGVAYDPKVSALCEQLGLPDCFPAQLHEAETLGRLRMFAITRNEVRESLPEKLARARSRLGLSDVRFRETFATCFRADANLNSQP
jgi:polysaccharide pyruvyl transferase CsaB